MPRHDLEDLLHQLAGLSHVRRAGLQHAPDRSTNGACLALGLLLLFLVSILIFVGTIILPGDVAESILGQSATPEALDNIRRDLGLNDPPVQRYFAWLGGVLQGDLGTALTSGQDIASVMWARLENTLFLAFWAAVISVPLAIFLGLLAVRYRDRWPDKLISGVTLASISVPEFLIAYVLMFFIGVKLRWLNPTAIGFRPDADVLSKLEAIALPVAVLTLVVLAHMMRMTRAAILNVMQSAYIETAELKGLSMFTIIWRHAFPNSIAPVVSVVMVEAVCSGNTSTPRSLSCLTMGDDFGSDPETRCPRFARISARADMPMPPMPMK